MGRRNGKNGGRGKSSKERFGFRLLELDPLNIRFAYSRVRPRFSGCDKTIEESTQEIRDGKTKVEDIPLITVVKCVANERGDRTDIDADGQHVFYVSLNNRRLLMFKALRHEGLVDCIPVRIRDVLDHEKERYTLNRCSLQGRIAGVSRKGGGKQMATAMNEETHEAHYSDASCMTCNHEQEMKHDDDSPDDSNDEEENEEELPHISMGAFAALRLLETGQ